MLESMGSQRVGYDLATEQQNRITQLCWDVAARWLAKISTI